MAVGPRKPRIDLGDVAPPPALAEATEERRYFTARVPESVIQSFDMAQAREGERKGYVFFMKVLRFYLEHNHPDLLR